MMRRRYVLKRINYRGDEPYDTYLVEAVFGATGPGWQGTPRISEASKFGRWTAHLLSALLPSTVGVDGELGWEPVEVEPVEFPE